MASMIQKRIERVINGKMYLCTQAQWDAYDAREFNACGFLDRRDWTSESVRRLRQEAATQRRAHARGELY